MTDQTFEGFSSDTLKFLLSLSRHNNKTWFEAHRAEYENHLVIPLKNLVSDLGVSMLSIDPYFEVTPAVNKTISRIYRDTRFSRDKSPFRPNMWIVFKRPGKEWHDAPGYFFEIFHDWYRYGMGFYTASPETMRKFREAIDENLDEFRETVAFYYRDNTYSLEGDKYKRIFDESKPPEILDWYQRKSFYLVHNSRIDDRLFSRQLLDELSVAFHTLAPLYHYIWQIKMRD
jgi:uncharacterized protein (TIGR02453 family)